MIYDSLTRWRTVAGLAGHPIWQTAFDWLETSAREAAEGIHPLGSEGFFARVMSYPLKSREVARYELHRHTIDVQYTLEGAERIELAAADQLTPLNDYSEAKEVEHFVTPLRGRAQVDNLPGCFTILFPGEAHMPQLEVPDFKSVRKVVVKIPARLVA